MSITVGEWIFLIFTAIMLLFAVLSNLLVIFCVLRYRKLRSVTNVMICNLAISDILLAGFVMPQKLHDITHEENFYEGVILCKVVNFSPIFIITSSIYTLVSISFERRRAIIECQTEQINYCTLCYKIIPAIWILGILVSVPTLVEYDVNYVTLKTNNTTVVLASCGSEHMSMIYSVSNAVFLALVSYLIPVVLMFKNYFHVTVFVWDTSKCMTTGTGNNSFHLVKSRKKLVKLLIAVAVIFAVSWLPFFVMLLYAKISRKDTSYYAGGFVNILLIALATFSTAYNVILYVVFNPSFSSAIRNLFILRKRQESNEININVEQFSPDVAVPRATVNM